MKHFSAKAEFNAYRLVLVIGLFLVSSQIQAASIEGRILDQDSGIYLEGVEIRIEGTDVKRFSQRGGAFAFRGLEPGTYDLTFRYSIYPDVTRRIVLEGEDSVALIEQSIGKGEVFELEAFTVEGTIIGQAKAFSQKRAASNIKEIIASDALGQFVDRNAAEALQRVAGISVEDSQGEGKFIIIRGADPSLNSIAIDGVIAATPEEDGRSTGLNIISIDQLERIEVTKTWLPDDWANFVGGSVNLITRSALDRDSAFSSIQFGVGRYDNRDEESYRGSLTQGFVFGKQRRFGIQVSLDWSEDNRGSDTLDVDGWDPGGLPELRMPPDGFVLQGISLEDFQIRRERIGVSTKLEFELNPKHRWNVSFSLNQYDDDEILQDTRFNPSSLPNDYSGPLTLTEERALALGYDLNDPEVAERVFGAGLIQRRMFFDEAVELGTIAFDEETKIYTLTNYTGDARKDLRATVTEDEIITVQFGGNHVFGDNLNLDYKVYQSEATKNWNARLLRFESTSADFVLGVEDGRPFVRETGELGKLMTPEGYRISDNQGLIQNNFFSSEDTREGAQANLSLDTNWGGWEWTTKAGVAFDGREKAFIRDFNQFSRIQVDGSGLLTMADAPFFGGELTGFLPDYGNYEFGPKFDIEGARNFITDPGEVEFLQIDDDRTTAVTDAILRNYEATEDIYAAYLMESLQLARWEFIAGLRWERTENTFTTNRVITKRENLEEEIKSVLPPTVQFIQPRFWQSLFNNFGEDSIIRKVTSERDYDNLLYAFHVKRTIGEDWILRGAITKTLARPRYTDLVPREIVSISGARYNSSARLPNFELEPMTSVNYDLSLSHYFKGFGLASVAVFYKDLDGPIYEEIRTLEGNDPLALELTNQYFSNPLDSPQWSTSVMRNAGEGELMGIELTFEKRFTELPSPLDGFGVSANATFIDSEVSLLAEERLGEKVPLFLQSDRLANVSLYYEKYGFLVKLSWNFRGKYLDDSVLAGTVIEEVEARLDLPRNALDVWVDDFSRIDLLVEYRPFSWMAVFFEGTNLGNEAQRRYIGDGSRLDEIQYTEAVYFVGMRLSF
jgi:TonB-dependent receptor